MWWYGILAVGLLGVVVLAVWGWGHWPGCRLRRRTRMLEQARRMFHLQREYLEWRFLELASQSGKPRGLEWVDCEFDNAVRFGRDRETGELRAFVGVTIRFRAVEGGGMEDVPAVGNLRAATAVFHYDAHSKKWSTYGRALFNVNPDQAIDFFHHESETAE
ncbi:MAG: hypothetical protein KatS3mg109_0541 [Pirellulaceae bacterium]|nr:MAG: hypothetical protein KatS3mg109_0541 [Pirellulaceae bacterium]